jgi:glycosyltransferase involved in cell wall biosynthesis
MVNDLEETMPQVVGNTSVQRPHLVFVVTSSCCLRFFSGQLEYLQSKGFDVSVISSAGPEQEAAREEGAAVYTVLMEREIALLKDIASLWRLWRLFRRTRPDLVNAGTPKAGLLGTLAARLAGVPHVVYTLHGLRLETMLGLKRKLLTIAERVACRCAHRVRCVSPSLQARAIGLGLVRPDKTVVVGPGTCNGVEVDRFRASLDARQKAGDLRRKLGIHQDAPVIGFVGRFTRDKGVPELYQAFISLREYRPNLRLLLVGDFEAGDPIAEDVRRAIEENPEVIRTGIVPDAAPYYHLMDMCVLPTYREGFPAVLLEAQAAGIPVITTPATGAIDSIQDGETGLLVPVGDASALARAIGSLLGDAAKRKEMGRRGQEWVTREFSREKVLAALARDYQSLILEKLGPGRSQVANGGSIERNR